MSAQDDLPCRELVELVTEYLEGTLPGDLRERFEAHLTICDGCAIYVGQMRLTVRALRNLGGHTAAPGAHMHRRDELVRRFQRKAG